MQLFFLNKDKLEFIDDHPFKLEKDIQNLCEKNLKEVFDLEFVSSEFSIGNFRIDTLAFDRASKSFVIIEYKRDKKFSVIDQGYAYLSVMLNNKADFILEYNENRRDSLGREDVDWSQSKTIFISPSFTAYQMEATNFKDLPIELWEVKRYSNKTVSFNFISTSGVKESIKTISRGNKEIENVNKQIKVYTEDEHLSNMPDEILELYEKFKSAILNISEEIKIKPVKRYISFKVKRNVVDVCIQKKAIKMWINLKKNNLDDPKGLFRDVSSTGHWGNGDYEVQVSDDENLEYIISLIKQSYKQNRL
ncbi:hypothetical protein EUAN_02500 [Andreesenia angusta]|uniref:DUF5655 domain-containing protein n=1 Tax=Andreesenia angusta TaxID=39480 RepID=A0A1S1V9W3_9FIRM|nr:DUF5655 domain-containing protein [Andreesenia angusta]OHW63386.1 hypothetical protein EUAN_02500 [Andreesenia angusta]